MAQHRSSSLSWEKLPPQSRPRRLPISPNGLSAFRTRRDWIPFAILLLPGWISGVLACQGGKAAAGAVALVVVLTLVAASAFVVLKTGVSSSNHGTFYRGSDGWRYWSDFSVLLVTYALFCVAPHIFIAKQGSEVALSAPTKPSVIDHQPITPGLKTP